MPYCPNCEHRYEDGIFACPFCEVILVRSALFEIPAGARKTTLIEALLTPPGKEESAARPKPPKPATKKYDPDAPTQAGDVMQPVPDEMCLRILDVDLEAAHLSEFEAHFLSFVDRKKPAIEIRKAAKLSAKEFASVVKALSGRGVLRLEVPTENREIRQRQPRRATPKPQPAYDGDVTAVEPSPAGSAPPPPKGAKANRPAPAPQRVPAPAPKPDLPWLQPTPPPKLRAVPLPAKRNANLPPPRAPARVSPLEEAVELEKSGKLKEAVDVLERAIRKSQNPAPLYNRLALLIVRNQRDFLRAERLLRMALELEPSNEVYDQNLMKIVVMAAADSGPKGRSKR